MMMGRDESDVVESSRSGLRGTKDDPALDASECPNWSNKKTRGNVDCCSCAHAFDDDSCGGQRGYSNRREARLVRSVENEEVVAENRVLLCFTVLIY